MRKEFIGAVSALALMSGAALAQSTSTQTPSNQGAGSSMSGSSSVQIQASADQMLGKEVIGADGQKLGEVEDVILDAQSGRAQQLVISSGGFLGIGEKQIAVPFQDAQLQPGENNIRLQNMTQAQVENLQAFEYQDNTVSLNRQQGQMGGTAPQHTPQAPGADSSAAGNAPTDTKPPSASEGLPDTRSNTPEGGSR